MKRLFILFIFFSTTVFAQDKRTFNVSGFDKLDMGSAFVINVTQASSYKVEVEGREQDVKDLVVKVSGGKLNIGYPNNWGGWKNRKEVYITITMPKLTEVDFSGASKSKVTGFSSDKLDISVSGASQATFNVDAKSLLLNCSGASGLNITGDGQTLSADVSGASSIDAYSFKVTNANVDASGASGVKVNVSSKIIAGASGASTVRYKGGANSVVANTSGAGSVKSAN
ncbi:head GIN domain-containing protein [Emticicia fontis]